MTQTNLCNHRIITRRIALLALAVCFTAACSNRNSGNASEKGAPDTSYLESPKRGGVLTMGTSWLPYNLDPIEGSANANIWSFQLLNDQLVRVRKDGIGVEPGLAESWDISPDGLVYTFHLRPNLTFSDGEPLRASDVKFSLVRAATDSKSTNASLYPSFKVETPDDRTCIIKLETPWPAALPVLALFSSSIIPEAYFKRVGDEKFSLSPVGAGPFVLKELRNGQHVILKRNPHHWESERPYLDEVRFILVADALTRMLKLQAGEIDVADDVPISQLEILRNAPGVTVDIAPMMSVTHLVLNPRKTAFKDARVRRAIHWAIDREELVRLAHSGHAEVATSFLPRMLYTDPEPSPQDLHKAGQLLASSASPGGLTAQLMFPAAWSDEPMATVIQHQLDRIGVHLELQRVDPATMLRRIQQGDYEALLGGGTSDTIDPIQCTNVVVVSTEEIAKWFGYDNPRVDELAARGKVEMNPEKRAAQYLEIQRIVRDDAVIIGLTRPNKRTGLRDYVHGFAVPPTANYLLQYTWKTP